ncbi:MAG: adenosylhomocysteinase [Chloroflexi bacterium]|nr:adenosylhomocysteinase [Chloroflexota bacterium]
MKAPPYEVKDLSQATSGQLRIEWAEAQMPVLRLIRERFQRERPLAGQIIAACLHVTTETANLMLTLKAGGASVAVCASNPLSTQDDVAAALVQDFEIPTFAIKGEDNEMYYRHIASVLATRPTITMDDGADLVSTIHKDRTELADGIIGGTEETTTGLVRLRSMAAAGVLRYPIIAVNDAETKHFFDNRYGTGQSTIDGILRATNVLLAGKAFVVCGYGWCGRGVASRARGLGSNVIVTEVHPVRALEAVMDGYRVMPIAEAAAIGDIFVTTTGDTSVIDQPHLERLKDGAILANAGHFDVEINLKALETKATAKRRIRGSVEEFQYADGRRVYLLAEGRLVNLAAAEGHPAAVMDMSFANQALAAEYLIQHRGELERRVYPVPQRIDHEIARLKLHSMGITIDTLTSEQQAYLASWQEGT